MKSPATVLRAGTAATHGSSTKPVPSAGSSGATADFDTGSQQKGDTEQ